MLTLTLIVVIVVIAALLRSLKYVKTVLQPAEICFNWLICSALGQHFLSILTLNSEIIKIYKSTRAEWTVELTVLGIMPSLAVWLLFAWFHDKLNILPKMVLTIWWFLLLAGAISILTLLGVIWFENRRIGSVWLQEVWFTLIFLILAHLFRYFLNKERRAA